MLLDYRSSQSLGPLMETASRTKVVLLGLATVCQAATAQANADTLKTVSVCELFNDLASHNGMRVKVRGILYSGREIFALGETTCTKKFVTRHRLLPELLGLSEQPTGEYVWPTAIDLSGSISSKGVSTDENAILQVVKILREARAAQQDKSTRVDLWVTVVGVLSIKDHYDGGPDAHGKLQASGYGHLGTYPAQLVIETMSDPEVSLTKE